MIAGRLRRIFSSSQSHQLKLTRAEPISPVSAPFRLFSPFFALMGASPPAPKKAENISKSTSDRCSQFCRSRFLLRQGKARGEYCRIVKSFNAAWAEICPSKPICVRLSSAESPELFYRLVVKALAYRLCRSSADDGVGRHVLGDKCTRSDYRTVADRNAGEDDGLVAYPHVVSDDDIAVIIPRLRY